jgi:hypothetical protein
MATVAKLTVSNASQVDAANWVSPRDVFGPQLIPSSAPRGPCVVQALTTPANSPTEWSQIAWAGGEAVPGRPNQRLFSRHQAGKTTVRATIVQASDAASDIADIKEEKVFKFIWTPHVRCAICAGLVAKRDTDYRAWLTRM